VLTRGFANYACQGTKQNHRSHVAMRQAPVDAFVEYTLLTRLAEPDAGRYFADDDEERARVADAGRELQALETRLKTFRLSAAQGGVSVEGLAVIESDLLPRIAAARDQATPRWLPSSVRQLLSAADVSRVWNDEFDLPTRRQVVSKLMWVRLHKDTRPRGSHGHDRSRIEIRWRPTR
jgi:hypothetical protein